MAFVSDKFQKQMWFSTNHHFETQDFIETRESLIIALQHGTASADASQEKGSLWSLL